MLLHDYKVRKGISRHNLDLPLIHPYAVFGGGAFPFGAVTVPGILVCIAWRGDGELHVS